MSVTLAVMFTLAMLMVMVVAAHSRIVAQLSCQQSRYRVIRVTAYAAVQLDARRSQGHLGTTTDSAANQCIHTVGAQETCQCSMTAAVSVHHLGLYHGTINYFIYLKLLSMAKMLKNHTIIICYCDFHKYTLLSNTFPVVSLLCCARATGSTSYY